MVSLLWPLFVAAADGAAVIAAIALVVQGQKKERRRRRKRKRWRTNQSRIKWTKWLDPFRVRPIMYLSLQTIINFFHDLIHF